jgi:putative FmdB family regulatory protein
MPTYEYECVRCKHHFEKFHGMNAAPLRKCPKCKGKVKKLPGLGAGIIFKGSGFYETDYKRKSGSEKASTYARSSEKEVKKPSSSESKSTTKSK